jgi:hypothetical protein
VVVLVTWLAASCGGDQGNEDVRAGSGTDMTATSRTGAPGADRETLDRQIAELDALLVEAIEAIGLDPAAARREMTPLPCVGAGAGIEGYNIEYYFADTSYDRGVEQVAALERHWEETEGVEITRPMGDPGEMPDLLAQTNELVLGAKRPPASEELSVGGSTGCW